MKRDNLITADNEGIVLAKLAGPMLVSMLGLVAFNLVDAFFVSRLGRVELAALSFTFPVVLTVGSIAHGMGVGLTTAVAYAVGQVFLVYLPLAWITAGRFELVGIFGALVFSYLVTGTVGYRLNFRCIAVGPGGFDRTGPSAKPRSMEGR
jgi:Na+-driven multidrug efflux pump